MTNLDPEKWLDDHGSALYSFALLHVRDAHKAEDLVQETFIAALKGQANFKGNASERTWLTSILKNKIIDEFRKQSREGITQNDPDEALEIAEAKQLDQNFKSDGHWAHPVGNWGNSEEEFSNNQFWQFIEHCLMSLSPKMSRLFLLREIWGMETDEVCKEMDISTSNLWTSLHRARLGMRQCLEKNLYN